ncbi:MAG: TetR family transcriptional regulator [Firmicutes bacterium]|nr:TetR family transcriptional regulator [Bacillota bacterium]
MKKSQITKQKILQAAEEEFAEKGIYGARVDKIAESAGVNKRMLYAHFTNKETLYATILSIVYERMSAMEEALLQNPKPPLEFVEELICAYFNFLYNNPSYVKLIMWENLNEAKYLSHSKAHTNRTKGFDLIRKAIEQGVKEKIFKPGIDISELTLSLNMFCFSYFSNIYTMSYLMDTDYKKPTELNKRRQYIVTLIVESIKI